MRPHFNVDTELNRLRLEHAILNYELTLIQRDFYARKFDPDQPRVPAGSPGGGQWGSGGGSATIQPAFLKPASRVIARGIEAGLALYGMLSGRNSPDRQAILDFNARSFQPDGSGGLDLNSIRLLDRDEANAACPRLAEVQSRVDRIDAAVRLELPNLSPTQHGTEVHVRLKNEIDSLNDPTFRAEVSYLKSREADRYGQKGSIRVDVDDDIDLDTVCVKDVKTGISPFGLPRMIEVAQRLYVARKRVPKQIIVTEVRPRR